MSSRAPKWKREGFKNREEYSAACSATRKTRQAAMAATNARYGTLKVLQIMWDEADFHRPFVTITKEQAMAKSHLGLSTIKKAWRELREEGSIRPAKGWEGGRRKATTWHLRVAGHKTTPSEDHVRAMQDAAERDAAWRFLKSKFGPMKAMQLMDEIELQEAVGNFGEDE